MKAIKNIKGWRCILLLMALTFLMPADVEGAGKKDNTEKGPASVAFVEKSHDFGNIKENGGPVSYEFVFTNEGESPLVIVSAMASCGCTMPRYPKAPIASGKTEKIRVTYLPKGRPGEFNKSVKVRTNDPKNKKVTLRISGVVVP